MSSTYVQVEEIENHLNEVGVRVRSSADDTIDEVADLLIEQMRESMGEGKSGRIYHLPSGPHQASAPGETPAILTGELSNSPEAHKRGWGAIEVIADAFHAAFLEYGTVHMAPRPFMKPAADAVGRILEIIAARAFGRIP